MLGRLFLLLALLLLAPLAVHAQPVCNPAVAPNSPACQAAATNLQPSDILLGQQATGPTRSNQTVQVPVSQLRPTATAPISVTGSAVGCPNCVTGSSGGGNLSATAPVTVTGKDVECPTCATTSGGGALTASSPLSITGDNYACPTCATVPSGGALAASGPVTLTGNTFGLGNTSFPVPINFDSQFVVHADTYYFPANWTWLTGSVGVVKYWTGGTSTPSFQFTIQRVRSGTATNITGCTGITVAATTNSSLSTAGSVTCNTNNTFVQGDALAVVISNVSGSPSSAHIEPVLSHSNP